MPIIVQHDPTISKFFVKFPGFTPEKEVVKGVGFRFDGPTTRWLGDAKQAARLSMIAGVQVGESAAAFLRSSLEAETKAKSAADANIEASARAESDAKLPLSLACVAAGHDYLPYQKAGIVYGASKPGVLIADEMGLGKTIQAIGIANVDERCRRILVVCPASLKKNWLREWRKWDVKGLSADEARSVVKTIDKVATTIHVWPTSDVVVVNYDMVEKFRDRIDAQAWDLLIVDECFPAGTMVHTEIGPVDIAEIVENRLPLRILCSESGGNLAFRSVSRYVKSTTERTVIVIHEGGRFECTPHHKIFLEGRGYVEAGKLAAGDRLRMVRGFPGRVAAAEKGAPVLRHVMFGEVAQQDVPEIAGRDGEVQGVRDGGHSRFETPRRIGKDAGAEFRPYYSRQTGRVCEIAKGKEFYRNEGRERFYNAATANGLRSNGMGGRPDGMVYSNFAGEGAVRMLAASLQGGLSGPGNDDGNRNRRVEPQLEEMEISGQAQNRDIECSRVVSVSVHERLGREGLAVYNLEIEEHHNYFANGVLVSNCHYLKNPKAGRTIAIMRRPRKNATPPTPAKLARDGSIEKPAKPGKPALPAREAVQAARCVFLTGTPILNRPIELFPIVERLDPKGLGASFFGFGKRYCAASQTSFGWDFSGASNLEELQSRLRGSIMVRRLKNDVLKELPPKRRQLMPLDRAETKALREAIEALEAEDARHGEGIARAVADVEIARGAGDEIAYAQAAAKLKSSQALAFTEMAKARYDLAIAKAPIVAERIVELLEGDPTLKIVVMAHHGDVVLKLRAALEGFGVAQVTGKTPVGDRQAECDRFQTDAACRVFLGTIRAAGVGLTLTAAALVAFVELDWVPGNVAQAEDRCHRIGQTDSVLVWHFVVDDSIDAKMVAALVSKQDVADRALNRGAVVEGQDSELLDFDPVVISDDAVEAAMRAIEKDDAARLAEEAEQRAEIEAGNAERDRKAKASKADQRVTQRAATSGIPIVLLRAEGNAMDERQRDAVAEHLYTLSSLDLDYANEKNDLGFSKADVYLGHSLEAACRSADMPPAFWGMARRLVLRYPRQIGGAEAVQALRVELPVTA